MSSRVVLIPCKESHLVQEVPTCAVQTMTGAVLPAQSVKVKTLPEIQKQHFPSGPFHSRNEQMPPALCSWFSAMLPVLMGSLRVHPNTKSA